uniref:Uncharacterized protein n=1 Tax=Glossina pallidipes TaxID=7398 RepID=A0A1A9Z727_GLOPL
MTTDAMLYIGSRFLDCCNLLFVENFILTHEPYRTLYHNNNCSAPYNILKSRKGYFTKKLRLSTGRHIQQSYSNFLHVIIIVIDLVSEEIWGIYVIKNCNRNTKHFFYDELVRRHK